MAALIAFGPETSRASWHWVGADTARELSKYFNVITFGPNETPAADVVFFIKNIPKAWQVEEIVRAGSRLVFVPVDLFVNESDIVRHSAFLRMCHLIIVHAASLVKHLDIYAKTRYIDHHGKYFLNDLSPYKGDGFALWIGAFANLPFLLQYINKHPLDIQIKILTDLDNRGARRRAQRTAKELGLTMTFDSIQANGMQLFRWSEELQLLMLKEARVAIDIKGESFNQQNKPATKAQKYICSGIPLAMNKSESTRYFSEHGLLIPEPTHKHWLSREYHDEICEAARSLRPQLSLESIGVRYKIMIEDILTRDLKVKGSYTQWATG